jgi:hypothetical protein
MRTLNAALLAILLLGSASAQIAISGDAKVSGDVTLSTTPTGPSYANNSCHGNGFTETSQTCVMSSNLKAIGDVLVAIVFNNGATPTLGLSGCSITWTAVGSTVSGAQVFDGTAANASACTLTGTSTVSGSTSVDAVEFTGTTGVDTSGADTTTTFETTPTPFNCHSVTTTDPYDLVVCAVIDVGSNGGTFSYGPGYVINHQTASFGNAIESGTKNVAGSVTPTGNYTVSTNFFTVTIALHI